MAIITFTWEGVHVQHCTGGGGGGGAIWGHSPIHVHVYVTGSEKTNHFVIKQFVQYH